MKPFSVRHSEAQHLKVEDLMKALGQGKTEVVRAALYIGLQSICEGIQDDKEAAFNKVAIAAMKAK